MAKKAISSPRADWAAAVGVTIEEVSTAWDDLRRRSLVSVRGGKPTVSPLALRRAVSDSQRRLAAHLAGFALTDNSYIVRRAGEPTSQATILNSRIAVAHIAQYFRDGAGVIDIQRDLPQLTRDEIEAAIQYYLNHRAEIQADLHRSQARYDANAPKLESAPA